MSHIAFPPHSSSDKVTEKRVQCNAKELAFLRSLPSDSNFGEVRVTQEQGQFNEKRLAFLRV
jgi:hypothetical protein